MTHKTQLPQRGSNAQKKRVYKKRVCGRRSLREKILAFARRNRVFRAGDLLIVFDIKLSYARWLVWKLEQEGVIVLKQKTKQFEERYYLYRGEKR